MLNKFFRFGQLVIVSGALCCLSVGSYAQTSLNQNQSDIKKACLVIAFTIDEVLKERQAGVSKDEATQNMYRQFVDTTPAESKSLFKQLVDDSIQDIYKIPDVGQTKEDQENVRKALALMFLDDCAKKNGLTLADFQHMVFKD